MAIQIDGDSGVSGVNGSATTPALQGTDSNTGIVFGTDEVQVATGGSTRATVDSSGRLLIGSSSAVTNVLTFAPSVQVEGTTANTSRITAIRNAAATGAFPSFICAKSRGTSNGSYTIVQSGDKIGAVEFAGADGAKFVGACSILAEVDGTPGLNDMPGRMIFSTSADGASGPTERMRIKSDGYIGLHGASTDSGASSGQKTFVNSGGQVYMAVNSNTVLFVNRNGSDGALVHLRQGDTTEGNISVSGSTVSYNGAHLSRWSQLAGGAERTEILRGSVLSNLDEMCEWAYDAQDAVLYTEEDELPEGVSVGDVKTPAKAAGVEDNEQLNRMKVSDVEGDPNVSGVFQGWDDDDDTYDNDFYCAMTGDFVIRIAQGTTVARGDLLMSAGDGTAKPQDDDIVRSKTIAKVTSTTVSTTYSDGSYCVPCVLMAC